MKRILAVALLLTTFAPVHAQSISPLISEYGKHARGQLTVSNNTLLPMAVVLEPRSIVFDVDGPKFMPLDSSVHLRLSRMSVRLDAKQIFIFDYDAECSSLPCSFAIFARFTNAQHVNSGIQVALHLEHMVYVCEKQKGCRESTLRSHGIQVAANR